MTSPAVFPLKAAASNIVFGDFGDSQADTAFLSGGNVFILHSSNFHMEALSLPVNASAMALGSFIFDRTGGLQIALLTSDGTLHIAARTEFDPRPLTADEFQARYASRPSRIMAIRWIRHAHCRRTASRSWRALPPLRLSPRARCRCSSARAFPTTAPTT